MILFPHMLVGALVGLKFRSYPAIFIFALISHFLMDMLPHWDYINGRLENLKGKKFIIFLTKAIADLFFGVVLIWYFFDSSPRLVYIFFGVFVGILPDGICLLNRLTNQRFKILRLFQALHQKLHWPENKKNLPLGLAVEGILTAIVLIYFFF